MTIKIPILITARKGSVGLPGKNIKEFNGKPLIAWSIELARSLSFVSKIEVSTDCIQISEIASTYGANIPFLRPDELSTSTSTTSEVILHWLNDFCARHGDPGYFLLLEPTSPLRDKDALEAAFVRLIECEDASVVSVGKHEGTHPVFTFGIDDEGGLIQSQGKWGQSQCRRQDIDDLYFLDGSFYFSSTKRFRSEKTFIHKRTLGSVVNKRYLVEIDDIDDFRIAEALAKYEKFQ